MIVPMDYASPSAFTSDGAGNAIGLCTNRRRPVRLHARVARSHVLSVRMALQALGELVWSNDSWLSDDEYFAIVLDPVITVHPDRVFFEAFSQDQSSYGVVIIDRSLLGCEGEVRHGTTNVDFTAWLWSALGQLRSSRDTWLRVGPEGFAVQTVGAGGRFEAKVDLPESWVRGFLQMQSAAAMPGTRLRVRPVDLLSAIRFLRYTKANVSPRALRWVFEPGMDARLVLEPWEHSVPLRGAEHTYAEMRTIRVWGRRRLKRIEPLLPFASAVRVYLKGRALPSFYAVDLQPGVTFVLGLSGWTGNAWTRTGGFDMLSLSDAPESGDTDAALRVLEQRHAMDVASIAERCGFDLRRAERAVMRLCRQGRAIFDIERREVRHRELFEEPPDEARLFPPDPRREATLRLVRTNQVHVTGVSVRETHKVRRLKAPDGPVERAMTYREWQVDGRAEGQTSQIVVGDTGRIVFGTCSCAFFRENLLNMGPCEHMAALLFASDHARTDLPSSVRLDRSSSEPEGDWRDA